jgi:hypothetical protein
MVDHHQYVVEHSIPIPHAKKINRFCSMKQKSIPLNLLVLNKLFAVLREYSLENKQLDFEDDLDNRDKIKLIVSKRQIYLLFYEQENVHHS